MPVERKTAAMIPIVSSRLGPFYDGDDCGYAHGEEQDPYDRVVKFFQVLFPERLPGRGRHHVGAILLPEGLDQVRRDARLCLKLDASSSKEIAVLSVMG